MNHIEPVFLKEEEGANLKVYVCVAPNYYVDVESSAIEEKELALTTIALNVVSNCDLNTDFMFKNNC